MTGYVSTDQDLWGLHRVLDGITGRALIGRGQGRPPPE
jgi:hypothetical protein